MLRRDQHTITEIPYYSLKTYFGLTINDFLRLISSLLLPLALGIFTVVITFHQQNVATKQRLEDRALAERQREQDLNISREQRLQDLNMFAIQREYDLNISREQHQLDKDIAEERRIQENIIAEKQRNLSEQQRAHELKIAQEQLRDSLLVNYMNDIGLLLKNNNGSLTSDSVTAILARAKTLVAIQQLDAARNAFLIQFLYEAKQLINGANPLDISDADLNGIDLSSETIFHKKLHNLSLTGTVLRNVSFSKCDLSYANFSGSDLRDARFIETKLDYVDFSRSSIVRTDFSDAVLRYTKFIDVQSRRIIFRHADLTNASFISSVLGQAVFVNSFCQNVNFSDASLKQADFTNAKLKDAILIRTQLERANFSRVNLSGMTLYKLNLLTSNFTDARCVETVFARANLNSAHFTRSNLLDADFSFADMEKINFFKANLRLATLLNTKLADAIFFQANVSMANFSFSIMSAKTNISNEQLLSSASIRGAVLPNGSVITQDPNLLRNGNANCDNYSSMSDWEVRPPNTIIISSINNDSLNCVFTSLTKNTSIMIQHVNLKRYVDLTSRYRVVIFVSARGGGHGTSIRVNNHKERKSINSIEQLSNEIFYEIFDYPLCQDIYKAFSNLNNRFETLLFNSSYLLKIRFSSEPEAILEDHYKHIIDSDKYQIISFDSSHQSLMNHL
ncbi:unnamed protein product [Rotaria sp. Silwood2]|nr:unnamed protein product [Rotaria sp. Silwood2]